MTATSQLRVLTLNEHENLEKSLFRLEKGWSLHFVLGPSLSDKHVRVFVNHPEDAKSGPHRQKYRELKWQNYSSTKADVYDNFAEFHMVLCGSFNYFFTTNGSDKETCASGCGYYLVDPILRLGQYDERIPLDCVACHTVLAKSLGLFPDWKDRLRVSMESGYNMIHFTPIQELGKSNSSYCIKNQLSLNSVFSDSNGKSYGFDDVTKLVEFMKKDWGVLSLTDLVFNHTANESPWIQEHPECSFNLVNSPHLKSAYLLDRIIWRFSEDIAEGRLREKGIPPEISNEEHLGCLRNVLANELIPKYNLHEFYLIHIENLVEEFRKQLQDLRASPARSYGTGSGDFNLIPDREYRRLKATVNMEQALVIYSTSHPHIYNKSDHVDRCCTAFRHKLEQLNHDKYCEIQSHLDAAVNNVIANARWRFVDGNGPRHPRVLVDDEPIMWKVSQIKHTPPPKWCILAVVSRSYFTIPSEQLSIDEEERRMHTDWGAHCMAHNGWVMGDDPLRNFAAPGSNVYLRRELIPWGDNVKLRYGDVPDDCPFLWQHMAKYARQTANMFHGVRLDNCHSTPIHVAEYMLDEARKVRPDLYVIAELFTSSEEMDNVFINRLGLNSLIREGLNAGDPQELGRLVHRYGGLPVGAFLQPPARPLVPCMAHAIFQDQTHDNPSPIERRSAFDLLPSSALVAMACCATGSNRGYDEMVPHHINVVTEERLYTKWSDMPVRSPDYVSTTTGIIAAKKVLNKLHQDLAMKGFSQVYVDQIKGDVVAVTRHNPVSHQSVITVARTAFSYPSSSHTEQFILTAPAFSYSNSTQTHQFNLITPGVIEEILFEGKMVHKTSSGQFQKNTHFINGLHEYQLQFRQNIKVTESEVVEEHNSSIFAQEVEFVTFPPGSVISFKVSLHSSVKKDILAIRQVLSQFGYRMRTLSARNVSDISSTELETIIVGLARNELNRVLYRCEQEEKDDGKGFGTYHLDGYGSLTYCGLQGIMSVLREIRTGNNLGHPLCSNLRSGDWMCDYIANRLKAFPATYQLGDWFGRVFAHLVRLPRYLIPCYFDAIVTGVYMLVEEVAWAKMHKFVATGSTFIRTLAMGSLQLLSVVPTAVLPPVSVNCDLPHPPVAEVNGVREQRCLSLAAGLPHFSFGVWRNWGRDTFISMRGLLMLTGGEKEARFIILSFGGTLRHGLIPNLLGEGVHARYNCRDSVWWWLYCVQEYCQTVKGGEKILTDKVSRMYPTDDSEPQIPGQDQCIHDVIQEILQRHAEGVSFRERNAPNIDDDMSDQGFDVSFGIDWKTGFVHGGNKHNCGTWMDKMGSSVKAGNKGLPATPRDGSAVELIGLCKSSVRWLADMYRQGHYPYDGVKFNKQGTETKITFEQWNRLIQENFEKCFWINSTQPSPDEARPDLVNKQGIYKDCVGASADWTDYQLRPNFPVAMVVAPELFTPDRAWSALDVAQQHLLGPLGMKTLDPSDWAYHGDYDNSNDSQVKKVAKGWNYHQGPEWLWPVGYFLRAKLYYARLLEKTSPGILEETVAFIRNTLSRHNVHVQTSPWQSLPELTNSDGKLCPDSCAAQAWSVASMLEVLYDLEQL